MSHSTVAVLQARMSSSRLPGKVLKPLAGIPMLRLLLDRLEGPVPVVVATSRLASDDPIEELAAEVDVPLVRGSLEDVLSRFVRVIDTFEPDVILRITGDNPMVDAAALKQADSTYRSALRERPDLVGLNNHLADRTDPYGFCVEAVDADRLRWLSAQDLTAEEREHVTLGLRHRGLYESYHLLGGDHRRLRWTVDLPEDLVYMNRLFETLGTTVDAVTAARWSHEHPHPAETGD